MKNKDFHNLFKSIDQARKIHAKKIKPSRVFKIVKLSETEYKKLIKELDSISCGGDYYYGSDYCHNNVYCDNHTIINKIKKLLDNEKN